MPEAGASGLESPEEKLLEMLNPTLEILPGFDAAHGKAVTRAWTHAPGVCRMALQNPKLLRSAARIVDGLVFFGRALETHLPE